MICFIAGSGDGSVYAWNVRNERKVTFDFSMTLRYIIF